MIKEAVQYYVKAFIALGLLTIIGMNAAMLPVVVIPFILLFYAILPTIGLTYTISVKRIYKQFRFTPDGKLGRLNRKWVLRLSLIFFVSLFSAIVFLINAPSWRVPEWLSIWIAACLYFPAFKLVQCFLRRELMPRFINAASIRASFVIVIIFVCAFYALFIASAQIDSPDKLSEAINSRPMYFQESGIVLFADLEFLTSFFNAVSSFALAKAALEFVVVGIIFRLISFASMLYGFVGILGFCMLSQKEASSVFKLLPAFDVDERIDENQPILKKYIIAILALWLIVIAVLGYAEAWTEKALQDSGTTPIREFVDNRLNTILQTIVWNEEKERLRNEFDTEKNKIVSKYENKLSELLSKYYEACENDIDSYLDWYSSFGGWVTNALKVIPPIRDNALNEFNSRVANAENSNVARSKFKHQYDNYRTQMNKLVNTYNQKLLDLDSEYDKVPFVPEISSAIGISAAPDQSLSLWPTLNSGNENERQVILNNILPSSEVASNREEFKNKLIALIEGEKQITFEALKRQFEL